MQRSLLRLTLALGTMLTASMTFAPYVQAQATSTPTASATATVATTATATATGTPAATGTPGPTATATPSTCTAPATNTPHDSRWFSQTGFRIDNDTFWDYYNKRGGIDAFGYPTSRTFQFLGFTTQFFQRRIMQIGPNGQARLLNLFDQGLFPFTNVNGSTFPAPDPSVQGQVPSQSSATYSTDVQAFIQANAPNSFNGKNVNFYNTYINQVGLNSAFPNGGGDTSLLPGFDLEMWGAVTSHPSVDPANSNFIYLRWQRGIMMYDGSTGLTQSVLLADYFKAIITGNNLPADLNLQAQQSSYYKQYNNCQANGLNSPALLPGTNMQYAFETV